MSWFVCKTAARYNAGMNVSPLPPLRLVLVTDDLLFPSRIREGLKPLGHRLSLAANEADARRAVAGDTNDGSGDGRAAAVLVNLSARRFDPNSLIRALKAEGATRDVPLLAFAGHVETEKHVAARAAGADMVAANSSVSLHLPKLLERLLAGEQHSDVPGDEPLAKAGIEG